MHEKNIVSILDIKLESLNPLGVVEGFFIRHFKIYDLLLSFINCFNGFIALLPYLIE